MDKSIALMRSQGVIVDTVRFIDNDIATGVYPDMREQGWPDDAWPDEVWPLVDAADILVIGGPLWLGDNSSITGQLIERLCSMSGLFNEKGQYVYYGKTAGALVTGNEDGVKHAAMSILYSLQHIGYSIPPAADAGWIGEVGPGPRRDGCRLCLNSAPLQGFLSPQSRPSRCERSNASRSTR
jgi:multimeric flavodoxin WrbA